MSTDDTFFGSKGDDRTVLRPMPGGRSRAPSPPPRAAMPLPPAPDMRLPAADAADVNRLAGAAAPLLSLAARLRTTVSHPDPGGLFAQVAQEIKAFEAAANALGARPEVVLTARYCLCTLLDEVVLNTPWGSQSVWASHTLLNLFHNEGWGGEKFFQILDRLLVQPAANLDLLELMYLCMAMGLQGKYRVHAAGKGQLDAVQATVLQTVQRLRGETPRELSPHWEGVTDARPALARYVPLWVVGLVTAGLLVAVYLGFLVMLNRASDPVAVQVAALGREVTPLVDRRPAPAPARLADLLREEIGRSALEVRQDGAAEVVVLREGLFASGSGEVNADRVPLIEAVGRALSELSGSVLITGHTDDRPIRTLRFPSNWQLSQRRADAVREILSGSVAPERLTAEGRADSAPLAANDTPANRSLNRRVEISLLSAPTRE